LIRSRKVSLKFFDCSACIGYGTVNREIINHENYPVIEKVKQPKNALELLEEMDNCGIDEAIIYHQTMIDVAPDYGNNIFLSDKSNYTGRLKGTLTILPSISDKNHSVDIIVKTVKKYDIAGLRAFPKQNRYILNGITCGDILDFCIQSNMTLYLSPKDGWEYIFDVLKEFPKLTVIITNYGLWGSDRYFFPLIKTYKNVYIDTSDYQVLSGIQTFVNKFGSERLLFGTNFPMDNMGGPKATLLGSKLRSEEIENIANRNISRLLDSRRI